LHLILSISYSIVYLIFENAKYSGISSIGQILKNIPIISILVIQKQYLQGFGVPKRSKITRLKDLLFSNLFLIKVY